MIAIQEVHNNPLITYTCILTQKVLLGPQQGSQGQGQ